MKFSILNRVKKDDIPFKDNLYKLVSVKGSRLILGYGYISKFLINTTKSSINDFYESIYEGFDGIDNPLLIIIGTNSKEYEKYYKALGYNILTYFKDIKGKDDLKVYTYISKDNYHKKVAIKYNHTGRDRELLSSIIGSSNLSARTLDELNDTFSQELDLLFWNGFDKDVNFKFSVDDDGLEIKYNISLNALDDISNVIDEVKDEALFKKYEITKLSIVDKMIKYYDDIKDNRYYLDVNKGEFIASIIHIENEADVTKWCSDINGSINKVINKKSRGEQLNYEEHLINTIRQTDRFMDNIESYVNKK